MQKEYYGKHLTIEQIGELMYQISIASDKYTEEPWQTLNIIAGYYQLTKDEMLDIYDFEKDFDKFMEDGTPIVIKPRDMICGRSKIYRWFKKLFRRK